MNRTWRRRLVIIGVSLQALVLLLGVGMMVVVMLKYPNELPARTEVMYAWFVFIVHAIGLGLAVYSLGLMGRQPKRAGVYLLLTGLLMIPLTLGATVIQSLLFMVAGLGCFRRQSYFLSA
ncbi:hypothetical protein N781_17475 [Pontibacillus halophilus JSM 076056 = DSM 19796]|uniref:DUF4064 domain-containing protein n=1 Tax=Pontibacillus halophilus JSM 076056 = DSM 19796 TaxID=1385510 RepID=A0A0A5GG92_9BACI|nr:hypothetical protein [Pontibacillus halophilus]KGX92271.1 hypothetical protein N781_17475 [Pontibacillus halophilus JSM 076056 = DSM 19796]